MTTSSAFALVGLLSLLGLGLWPVGARGAAEPPTVAGPFEIAPQPKKIGAGGFPNTSSNPFARMTVTVFAVKYRGKPVTVQSDKARLDEFWDALVLEGAPRPTVLAAVTGIHLITEDNGRLRTVELAPSSTSIATLQWLDSQDGQPGEPRLVTIRSRAGEPRTLGGGTLLLLNRTVVLDARTLQTFPVRFYDHAGQLDEFSASGEPVRGLSPGKTQLVAVGSRRRNDRFEYALVAAEYQTGRLYAVPFDRTATRFESVWDATPDWLRHYFAWSSGPDGRERLALRKNVTPRPWMGRFVRFAGGMVEYRLEPVRPEMLRTFLDFLEREHKVKPSAADASSATVVIEGWPLKVWHRAEDQRVSLYAETSRTGSTAPAYALIEKIGARFNAELARGEHQSRFASYDGDS